MNDQRLQDHEERQNEKREVEEEKEEAEEDKESTHATTQKLNSDESMLKMLLEQAPETMATSEEAIQGQS